eukprot:254107-Amphidinium_carterae.1
MHWTVQAQILRRGGLKHQPRVEPQDVDSKVQALRDAHKSDEKTKRAEGMERAKSTGLRAGGEWSSSHSIREEHAGEVSEAAAATWVVPQEYLDAEWTSAEDDLRRWCQGPTSDWIQGDKQSSWSASEAQPEAGLLQQSTYQQYQELSRSAAESVLRPLPLRLQVICRARLVQEKREYTASEVEKLLQELAHDTDPELRQEAQSALPRCGAADCPPKVILQERDWPTSISPGHGSVHYQQCTWAKLDYGDQLPISADLTFVAGNEVGRLEEKQCLVVNAAAAFLMMQGEAEPSKEAVLQKAQEWRLELWLQAEQFTQAVGTVAGVTTPTEHDLHVFAHDALCWHHDKDFRTYIAFNIYDLHDAMLHILRVDDWLQPRLDCLQGPAYLEGSGKDIWVLIHQRHMSALRLIEGEWMSDVRVPEQSMLCTGWESALQVAMETEECSVLNQVAQRCPHCRRMKRKADMADKIGGGDLSAESTLGDKDIEELPKCVSQWGRVGRDPLHWALQQEEAPGDQASLQPQPAVAEHMTTEFKDLCREIENELSKQILPLAPARAATKTSKRVRQLHLGAYVTHGRGVTKSTVQWQRLGNMVHRLARFEPSIGDYTTAMVVQAEEIGLHRDLHNAGQSWTLALGDFSAGRLWCEHPHGHHAPPGFLQGETPLRGHWYQTHWQWTPLHAQRWHAVEAWQGCRWALILYTPVAVGKLPPVDWATLHQAGFPVTHLQAELLDPAAQQQFHCIVNKACKGSRIGQLGAHLHCSHLSTPSSPLLGVDIPSCSESHEPPGSGTLRRCCSCDRHVRIGSVCAWCPHWACQRCLCSLVMPNGVDLVCRCCAPDYGPDTAHAQRGLCGDSERGGASS